METELCKLAYKYGSDKCAKLKHAYTPYYYELFKDMRLTTKKVLEIGIGFHVGMEHVEKVKGKYLTGASLYMWRDFFPNANIYGADMDQRTLFKDDRISTFYCDQTKKEDLENLIRQTGYDIDIVIDDGSHNWQDQTFACLNLMPLLQKNVFYLIEDIKQPDKIVESLKDYDCTVAPIRRRHSDDNIILVRHKK